ncbi:hypothetical protein MIND_00675000 [Mycena indigotica]|uniref:Pyridoxal-dependent decarboxylase n=1 Tax=Mycena indigotica TaxID=2126181 RepID=A0A8H6SLN8_9AGAR|nr:uncharacterized protein MIND_00675000 [Mycena indigotica]KAF7301110.1 hypothetical protein MIND_00675000 [Mycena indigotica]
MIQRADEGIRRMESVTPRRSLSLAMSFHEDGGHDISNENGHSTAFHVVHRSAICHDDGVSEQTILDVLHSTLFVQLATKKQHEEWVSRYKELLAVIGWVDQSHTSLQTTRHAVSSSVADYAIHWLESTDSASRDVVNRLINTIRSLERLEANSDALKLFNSMAISDDKTSAIFQIAAVSHDNSNAPLLTSLICAYRSHDIDDALFFHPQDDNDLELHLQLSVFVLNAQVYAHARQSIKDRLATHISEGIVSTAHDTLKLEIRSKPTWSYKTWMTNWTNEETHQAVPDESTLATARDALITRLPEGGCGLGSIKEHLLKDIAGGFTSSSRSATYFAYTTGGVTDAALFAEWVASTYDQNVAVHLPNESIATTLEATTLRLLQQLLNFDQDTFAGRIFTTGATASNLLGLALGREYVVAEAGRRKSRPVNSSIAELGLLEACSHAGVSDIQVLTTCPHSSLYKAASVVGLGRESVVVLPRNEEEPWRFDLDALASKLANGSASIVSVSAGEVSSGKFATDGEDMKHIRALADQYGAWIHVDGAFGLQARILPQSKEYSRLRSGVSNLELADSIAGDCHKLLQSPYDCGFFFSKHAQLQEQVFRNPNAAYLATALSSILSPLNIGLENSRRFRALPVYSSLVAYGRSWYQALLERQIALTRRLAAYIVNSTVYDLLPNDKLEEVYMVLLFRAKDDEMNKQLVGLINSDNQIHVSGMSWQGVQVARIAVGTWRVDVDRDLKVVVDKLEKIAQEWKSQV